MVKKGITNGRESKIKKQKSGVSGIKQNEQQGSKRPTPGTQSTAGVKGRRVPRSTAGFSLYSSDSEKDSTVKAAADAPREGVSPVRREVVTQIQLEERKFEPGIIIPVAGTETPAERSYDDMAVGFEVNTPFNKRLISSTPDPERLLQAEMWERSGQGEGVVLSQGTWQHENPGLRSHETAGLPPQLIPERDTEQGHHHLLRKPPATGADPSFVKQMLPLSNELFEKLKQQRQHSQGVRSDVRQGMWDLEGAAAHLVVGSNPVTTGVVKDGVPPDGLIYHNPKAEWVIQTDSNLSNNSSTIYSSRGERSWNVLKPDASIDLSAPYKSRTLQQTQNSDTKHEQNDDNAKTSKHKTKTSSSKSVVKKNIPGQASMKTLSRNESKPLTNSKNENVSHIKTVPEKNLQNNPKHSLSKKVNSKSEEIAPNSSQSETDSVYQSFSQTTSLTSKTSDSSSHTSAFKSVPSKDIDFNDFRNVVKKLNEAIPGLDLTADTCDEEVSQTIQSASLRPEDAAAQIVNDHHTSTDGEGRREETPSSEGNNLSQVIEFLKTEAFAVRGDGGSNNVNTDTQTEKSPRDDKTTGSAVLSEDVNQDSDRTDRDSGVASHLQTPGRQEQITDTSDTSAEHGAQKTVNFHLSPDIKSNQGCDLEFKEISNDEKDFVTTAEESECNVNQNCINVNNNQPRNPPRRQSNLQYLEKLADPYLRETACRLAFKASAIRDTELRDLIDDMIYYTDAALGHEDARFHSSQMFFNEENSKLKKRVHNVNRQLDSKERQERMGGNRFGSSNNDVLHLERKLMYLTQEKDRLDSQMTGMLEEKAKWLITQQDMIRTISIKDHEILKLEEKHQEERIRLHQRIDEATKGSTGVHYKLAVADREIANLEDRIKCKDTEMEKLREKICRLQEDLKSCEEDSREKDRTVERLQGLVDTLKLGVNHVLQAYEADPQGEEADQYRRQGMESLRKMAGPPLYRDVVNDSFRSQSMRQQPVTRADRICSQYGFNTTNFSKTTRKPLPQGRLDTYNKIPRTDMPQNVPQNMPQNIPQNMPQNRPQKEPPVFRSSETIIKDNLDILNSIENKRNDLIKLKGFHKLRRRLRRHSGGSKDDLSGPGDIGLTRQALEEHNRCLSPVDHSLWRSHDDGPVAPPVYGHEPYFSDSEIVVNNRDRRSGRFSKTRLRRSPPGGGEAKHVCFVSQSRPTASGQFEVHCDCRPVRQDEVPETYYFDKVNDRSRGETRSRDRQRERSSDRERERSRERERDKSRERSRHVTYMDDYGETNDLENMTLESCTIPNTIGAESRESYRNARYGAQLATSKPLSESTERFSRGIDRKGFTSTQTRGASDWQTRDFLSTSDPTAARFRSNNDEQFRNTTLRSQGRQPTFTDNEDEIRFVTINPDPDSKIYGESRQGYQSKDKSFRSASSSPVVHFERCGRDVRSRERDGDTDGFIYSDLPEVGSEFHSDRQSFPTQSSPRRLSDVSVSRRATRGSEYTQNITQKDFFQGTELSASLSSISDVDLTRNNNHDLNCNNNDSSYSSGTVTFCTGIATLDEKIANLQAKIDRTKAVFS